MERIFTVGAAVATFALVTGIVLCIHGWALGIAYAVMLFLTFAVTALTVRLRDSDSTEPTFMASVITIGSGSGIVAIMVYAAILLTWLFFPRSFGMSLWKACAFVAFAGLIGTIIALVEFRTEPAEERVTFDAGT